MPARSGRLEKRIPQAIPVEISALQDQAATERPYTENVCSSGARVLTHLPMQLNERLLIRSLSGELRAMARVVYCQRISGGRFAVGKEFLGVRAKWTSAPGTGASD